MAAIVAMGRLLDRVDRIEHAVVFSAGILLLWRPEFIAEVGFQMSYAATLGIVLAAPLASPLAGVGRPWRYAVLLVGASLSAQAALAPLLIHYFGRVSLTGFLANVPAIPLAGIGLGGGVMLAVLDVFFPAGFWPTAWVAWGVGKTLALLEGTASFFSGSPGAEIRLPWTAAQSVWLGLGLGATFLTAARRGKGWRGMAGIWAVALAAILWCGRGRPAGPLLTWLNPSRGTLCVWIGPEGNAVAVTTSTDRDARWILAPYLKCRGVRRLESVLVPELTEDSLEGVRSLALDFPIGEVWVPPGISDGELSALGDGMVVKKWTDGMSRPAGGALWACHVAPSSLGRTVLLGWSWEGKKVWMGIPGGRREQRELLPLLRGPADVVEWPRRNGGDLARALQPRWWVVKGRPTERITAATGGRAYFLSRAGALMWTPGAGGPRPFVKEGHP
jgi:hypothetical protein